MTIITISAAGYDAAIDTIGGGLHSLHHRGDAITTTSSQQERPGTWDGAVLAPWPNRIGRGRFRFGGRDHELPLNDRGRPNALHGTAWSATWNAVERDSRSVRIATVLPPSPGYPWTVALDVAYSLDDDGLSMRAEARNLGDAAAPFGFGFHPYLLAPGGDLDRCALRFAASTRLRTDDQLLPIDEVRIEATDYDFSTPRRVAGLELDTAFGSLERGPDDVATVTLDGPDGAGAIGCWWDGSFPWLQLYTPPADGTRPRSAIAVEPITCPPNAFNSGVDVIELRPTDSWSGAAGIVARR